MDEKIPTKTFIANFGHFPDEATKIEPTQIIGEATLDEEFLNEKSSDANFEHFPFQVPKINLDAILYQFQLLSEVIDANDFDEERKTSVQNTLKDLSKVYSDIKIKQEPTEIKEPMESEGQLLIKQEPIETFSDFCPPDNK